MVILKLIFRKKKHYLSAMIRLNSRVRGPCTSKNLTFISDSATRLLPGKFDKVLLPRIDGSSCKNNGKISEARRI